MSTAGTLAGMFANTEFEDFPPSHTLLYHQMYYIVYVFQGAGVTGRHGELVASSVQYVLNVVATIPAIIFIDRWGRRPMLLIGSTAMCIWLFLVGALQGGFGHQGSIE